MPNDVITLPDAPTDLAAVLAEGGAIAWEQSVLIATYEPAEADQYPMFLDRRVYQGSGGRVYPIPFTDRVATESVRREWTAVHLENAWIRLMVLPELGGRIHIGFDKVAGYDFFYRNNVIKPALVGLAGPWVSGGVEFNWPQHHRPSTFLPVDFEIEHHDDGAVTVWCSDHDPFTRMKGMHGIRLHPDRAVVELVVRLHNRTSQAQTFLWWANAAVRVHDDYQSFFPTDVRFVADHARRAITAFPAADRPYYGIDYPARASTGGNRLDFCRNIPVPTSFMIIDSVDDFFGGYDHAAGAGFVHVADRHVAPGKKQWTWGNAPFGHAWDALLTDSDGPYIELMAGVYTDNQPDFAWLQPGETKTFTQSWLPIQQIGVVHQSNLEVAVHLDVVDGNASIGVCVTRVRPQTHVTLTAGTETVLNWRGHLAPGEPLLGVYPVGYVDPTDVELVVSNGDTELLRWRPRAITRGIEPDVATEPAIPTEIDSADELYLTGVHLAQYRHPTRSPLPYWREALLKDPLDARSNLALSDDAYRRGLYETAEWHVRAALERITSRNNNPRDGEVFYLLGLILTRTGRPVEAIDAFAKAAWDGRWAAPALFEAARLHAQAGDYAEALDYAQRATRRDPDDTRVQVLEAVLLRRLGDSARAQELLRVTLAVDPLDQMARALGGEALTIDPRTLIDIALDCEAAGATELALDLLERAGRLPATAAGESRPMVHYHRAAILERLGLGGEAEQARELARNVDAIRCFPSGLDDHDALRLALVADPRDTRALALLATLLVDQDRAEEALVLWRRAIDFGLTDAVSFRNAAIASFNLEDDAERALDWYEKAIVLRPADARLRYESDQLLARIGASPGVRLERLVAHLDVILGRDDATIELCDLLTSEGRAEEAIAIMMSRRFSPWEGGEGRSLRSWENAHIAMAQTALEQENAAEALEYLDAALAPPVTLGEMPHPLASIATILVRRAAVLDALGRRSEADAAREAAKFQPQALGHEPNAPVDYFATSLPELLLFTRDRRKRSTSASRENSPAPLGS